MFKKLLASLTPASQQPIDGGKPEGGQMVKLAKTGRIWQAAFSGDAVRAAILGAQQGRVMYPEFKKLSQRAGCVGYTVWISGRHVVYLGRKGETHVERFPD